MLKKLIFSLIITIAISRIYLINPTTQLIGDSGDNYEFFAFMHIAKENIKEHYFPFVDSDILRYPAGFGFSYGYDGGFAVLAGGLLGLVTSQVLAYNLTLTLILFLNLFVAIYCFYRIALLLEISQAELKSYIAGVVFALSPFAIARINSHLNLAFVAGLPILLYGLVVLFNNYSKQLPFTRLDFARLLFGMLLFSLGSLQYLIIVAYLFVFISLLIFIVPPLRKYMPLYSYLYANIKNGFFDMAFVVLMVFLFFYWGYFFAILNGDLVYVNPASRGLHYSNPIDLIVPNPYSGAIYDEISTSEYSIERVSAIGLVELLLLLYLLVKSFKDRAWFLSIVGFLLLYVVIALNAFSIPLYPEGGRFVIFVSLLLGLLVVKYLNTSNAKILIIVLLLLLAERATFDVKFHDLPDFSFTNVFAEESTSILNIPVDKYNSLYSAMPYFYGDKKIFDGYFHHTAANPEADRYLVGEAPLAKFVCSKNNSFLPSEDEFNEIVAFLFEHGTKYIVVYKNDYNSKFYYEICDNVRSAWYWFNSPKYDLWESSPEVRSHTFELPLNQKHIKAEVFIQKSGVFSLNGLYINPVALDNIKVTLPNGQEINPEFKIVNDGNSVEFIPPLTLEVTAGDFLTISSDAKIDDNKYITLYYVYEAWLDSDPKKLHLLERVFANESVEVFKLNYE